VVESPGEKLTKPPVPLKGRLILEFSLFVWNCTKVDVVEHAVWNCIEVPLLLQMEKEMEDEVS